MYKTLLKKQMLEVNSWLILNKRSGKRRSASSMIAMAIMWAAIFIGLGGIFFGVGTMMCDPLVSLDLGWMYIVMMAFMAIMLGVFGSVFNVNATMYQARDNELLLSLPVKPAAILTARLAGVWMWTLLYEAIVFVPALIVYWMTLYEMGSLTVWIVADNILMTMLLSIFILTLSCVLGWAVAKISAKLKGRSYVTVILSLIFIALYYLVYFKANAILKDILANALTIGVKVKGSAYPLYLMGRMGEGDLIATVLVAAVILLLFALCWNIMSRSFISMATVKVGSRVKKYKPGTSKTRSIGGALLFKEKSRFTSSSTYMMNCGLGTIIMPVAGVVLLFKADILTDVFGEQPSFLAMILCAGLCMMTSMNDITAPSVSLEGKNLWLIQSLPVDTWAVLKAKLNLHLILTLIPTIFCSICAIIAVRITQTMSVFIIVLPVLFVILTALFGLVVNLKTPNLKWTNETVPVKQSAGVFLSMLGGWAFVIALGGLYYLLRNTVSTEVFMGICGVLFAVLDAALYLWLKRRGTLIFQQL